MRRRTSSLTGGGGSRSSALIALALYSVLTILAFRPLVTGLATVSIPTGDVFGNIWALTWVGRHLATPTHLFEANIYYPDPRSLAYTESLLAQSVVAGPLLGLGMSPIAAYNVVWLLSFPLCGLGAYLLARHFCDSWIGAFLAGSAYAFSAYRLESLAHVQSLSIQWLPFILLMLLRSLREPSFLNLASLMACVLLQALSSGYYAALLAPALLVTWLFHLSVGRQASARVLVALALTGLLAVPAFLPYWQLQHDLDLQRGRREAIRWSARWHSYLRPSGWAWFPTLLPLRRAVQDGFALYPGTAVLALAMAALTRRKRPAGYLAALAAVGIALSLGPEIRLGPLELPGPFEALRHLPGYRLLRTPYRAAPLALLALAVLAAVGYAGLAERSHVFRRWGWLLALLTLCESVPVTAASAFSAMPEEPPFVGWLARAPRGAVIELPWSDYDGQSAYWSIFHEQRQVNGWGAFAARESMRLGGVGNRWPRPVASWIFRGARITYVVEHTDRLTRARRRRSLATSHLPDGVALVAVLGPDRIYIISSEGRTAPLPGAPLPARER